MDEDGAQPCVLVRLQRGLAVRILNRDVGPIDNSGNAGFDRTEQADERRGIDIVRLKARGIDGGVGRIQVAKERLPDMPVRIHETRHHDAVRCIDDLCISGVQTASYFGHDAVVDQKVGFGEVRSVDAKRQDTTASDQNPRAQIVPPMSIESWRNSIPLGVVSEHLDRIVALDNRALQTIAQDLVSEPACRCAQSG